MVGRSWILGATGELFHFGGRTGRAGSSSGSRDKSQS